MSQDLKDTDTLLSSGQVRRDGKRWGCHVDLTDGDRPDGCVLQEGLPDDCAFGILKSGNSRRSRWTCPHWKKVSS